MRLSFFRVAKRVRDVAGGVSQCGEQRSTEAVAKPRTARPAGERPKKNQCGNYRMN
ncbi:MAG: hypothetical protein JNM36_07835 [Chitinophagales bacterium]|nr:hypothetical protein [Chitinophagales bacterium]